MSHWPEPTPDPAEPPRWPGRAALVVIASAIAILAVSENDSLGSLGRTWRPPEMPQITLPNFGGHEATEPPSSLDISERDPASLFAAAAEADRPLVEPAPFEACLETIDGAMNILDQRAAALIEDTTDHQVARFKFLEGNLTITCSRPNGTMTIEQ